jgi:twitching motility protein PilT
MLVGFSVLFELSKWQTYLTRNNDDGSCQLYVMLVPYVSLKTTTRTPVMNFEQLLKFGVDQGASAIHLQAEASPQLRIAGLIRNVEGPPVKAEELKTFIASIAPKSVGADIDRSLAVGSIFSTSIAPGRFRCSTFTHIGGPSLVLRVIPTTIRSVEELNLPRAVREIVLASRGLTLVVGPSGSGKTTTLAAMVDVINGASYQKIVTIEAPVEYLHANKKAMITQMEVGRNVTSFEHGLSLALQQDPDVIVVGDVRDAAVARLVLGAAEAGRKVLAIMTGLYAAQAIARFLSLIPPDERETACPQLAALLDGVIAQRLAKTRDGKFRPVVEVFRGGPVSSGPILENRLKDLSYFIEGRQGGMQSLDQHLIELNQSGVISGTETMRLATNPEAVGVGLRALRQADSGAVPAAPDLVGSEPGLQP